MHDTLGYLRSPLAGGAPAPPVCCSAVCCRRSSKGGFLARFWQNLAIAEGTKIVEKPLFFYQTRYENGVCGEKKSKFGRHAESIGPGVSKQGFGSPKMSKKRQKNGPKGVRKATLHSEGAVFGDVRGGVSRAKMWFIAGTYCEIKENL